VRSMCCRLRLDKRELQKRGGGLFGSNPLTGSVGVVTLNLPRIGHEAGSEEEFLQLLGSRMELAKESLIIKREVLEKFTERGLYPYSRFYLRNIKAGFGSYWKNHFSTIGIIGMNDAVYNLMGLDLTQAEGVGFTERTLDFIRARLVDFQEETGSIFNLEATPAEGTSYRLARIDRKLFPEIKIYSEDAYRGAKGRLSAGSGAHRLRAPYYTNSTQLPVGFTDDVFEALKLQDPLQSRYTGGTVLHAFLGEMPSSEAAKTLVKTIAANFHLPYYTLTPTFSICEQHGYLRGEQPVCPRCGQSCEVWSRSVGYLRPVDQWNPGKQVEFADRRPYDRQLDTQSPPAVRGEEDEAGGDPVGAVGSGGHGLAAMPASEAAAV
jgi:anaerobic ribonucleoside-triphosphate reductase